MTASFIYHYIFAAENTLAQVRAAPSKLSAAWSIRLLDVVAVLQGSRCLASVHHPR